MQGVELGGTLWDSDMLSAVASTSKLDTLLQDPSCPLVAVLNQDDVIQECRANNAALLDYLSRPEILMQSIRHVLLTAEETDAMEERDVLRYAYLSAELFSCGVDRLLEALITLDGAMRLLFGFLETRQELSSIIAGHFCKIMTALTRLKPQKFFVHNPRHISDLVFHTSSLSIMEALVQIAWEEVQTDEDDASWLVDVKLIPQLIQCLGPASSEDIHANVSFALVDLVSKSPMNSPCTLLHEMMRPQQLQQLVHAVFDECSTSFEHGSRILIALLQRMAPAESEKKTLDPNGDPDDLIRLLTVHMSRIMSFLKQEPSGDMNTTHGPIVPLGQRRLRAVELCCNLMQFSDLGLQQAVRREGVWPVLLDLFFAYPWHNILHNYVESGMQLLLAAGPGVVSEYRSALFEDAKLVQRLMQSHETNEAAMQQTQTRLGYMAFVTRIGVILTNQQAHDSELGSLIGNNADWGEYVLTYLRPEQNRMMTVLGEDRAGDTYSVTESDNDVFEANFDEHAETFGDAEKWNAFGDDLGWSSFNNDGAFDEIKE